MSDPITAEVVEVKRQERPELWGIVDLDVACRTQAEAEQALEGWNGVHPRRVGQAVIIRIPSDSELRERADREELVAEIEKLLATINRMMEE